MVKRDILTVFVLALLVRSAYIALVPPRSMQLDDSRQWNNTALHFLKGEGFLTHTEDLDPKRPPVYPLFLAANYLIFGSENFFAAKISQAFVNAFTCLLIYGIAVLLFGERVAFWSGIATALYPPLIVYSEILQSETVYTFLLMLFLFLWLYSYQNHKWPLFIFAGIVLGLLNLCRGTMLFFTFWILAASLLLRAERKNFWNYSVLIFVSFAVIAPWTWRNYKLYGGFMPIAAGGSEMVWFGTLPWEEQRLFGLAPSLQGFTKIKDPIQAERSFSRAALANIVANPLSYARLCLKKFTFFWFQPVGQKLTQKRFPLLGKLLFVAHMLLIITSIFGVIKIRVLWRKFLPLYLIFIYFSLVHTILAPEPRYRLPIEPYLILFSVFFFVNHLPLQEESPTC